MKRLLLLAFAIVCFSSTSFAKEKTWREYSFTEKDLRRQPANVQLPAGLWEKLDAFARATGVLNKLA